MTKRARIYERDGGRCVYCCRALRFDAFFTLDHVLPLRAGGRSDRANLVLACAQCNGEKGDRVLTDAWKAFDLAAWLTALSPQLRDQYWRAVWKLVWPAPEIKPQRLRVFGTLADLTPTRREAAAVSSAEVS